MNHTFIVVVSTVCLFFLNCPSRAGEADNVIRAVREARRKWKTGEFTVDVHYQHSARMVEYRRTYSGRFTPKHLRVDHSQDNGPGSDAFQVVNIVSDDSHLFYTTMKTGAGKERVTSWIKDLEVSSENPAQIISDPRYLGLALSAWEVAFQLQPEACFTGTIKSGVTPTIRDETLNGLPCSVVTYNATKGDPTLDDNGFELSAWVAPTMQYSVLKLELSENQTLSILETEYQEKDGLFLPMSYSYRRTVDDQIEQQEEAIIRFEKMNETIDPQQFELAGIPPDIGTPFHVYPKPEVETTDMFSWDGTKLVPQGSFITRPKQSMKKEASNWWPIFLILNSILLALMGGIFILKRRSTPEN